MSTLDINLTNVQETLESGTNIKTINGESILGSGNISISGGGTPGGSDTQIQFNSSGAFGASSNITYNGTTFQITGTGSTSATTAFLVQNSSEEEALKVDDNKQVFIDRVLWSNRSGNRVFFDGGSSLTMGSTSFTSVIFDGSNSKLTLSGNRAIFDIAGTEVARFTNDGYFGLGTDTPTARLHLVGSGATSATSNVLIQNSSSTDLIRIFDSGTTRWGTGSGDVEILTGSTTGGNGFINIRRSGSEGQVAGYFNFNSLKFIASASDQTSIQLFGSSHGTNANEIVFRSGNVTSLTMKSDGSWNAPNIPTSRPSTVGDLYIDTAANIAANGDLVLGIRQ